MHCGELSIFSLAHPKATNPVGEMWQFLAGTGWLMLTGAILLNLAINSDEGIAVSVYALCGAAALWTAFKGFVSMGRFINSAPNIGLGVFLALFTGFFGLLTGGLLGVVAYAMISKAVFGEV